VKLSILGSIIGAVSTEGSFFSDAFTLEHLFELLEGNHAIFGDIVLQDD